MSTYDQRCIAQVREALAEDARTNALDLEVFIREGQMVVRGPVETGDRSEQAEEVARSACSQLTIVNETWVAEHRQVSVETANDAVRLAAVGDLHVGRDAAGLLRLRLTPIGHHADVLLLAGDLTQHGDVDEARVLAADLAGLPVPVVAVLGNHDYHRSQEHEIHRVLQDAGVTVLEADSVVLRLRGRRVGIAGAKGFGGGFAGACATEFGEEEMKAFVGHTKRQAEALLGAFSSMGEVDVRVALTHYSPVPDTLEGERREIYPFLGSYLLEEALDASECDIAFHGHAHKGIENGATAGGVPVRNVALPVIRDAYRVYLLDGKSRRVSRARATEVALAG